MSDANWHDSSFLLQHGGLRYSSRLAELRKNFGISVEVERVASDVFRYRWVDAHRLPAILATMNGHTSPPAAPRQMVLV